MAVVEYAHLVVKLDLKEAMAQVKEACENIQRTADHCRQHAHGMDIHELMLGQDDLCEAYICLLYTSPSPRDLSTSRMPSSA